MSAVSVVADPPSWLRTFWSELDARDAREKQSIDIVVSQNRLLESCSSLRDKNEELEKLVASLRIQNAEALRNAALSQDTGAQENTKRTFELEKQISDLNLERVEVYRRVVELMDGIKTYEEKIKQAQAEIVSLSTRLKQTTTQLNDCTALIKEKDNVIQILRDELATHQLELSQLEEQMKVKDERLKTMEGENAELVKRWMELKQEEAARMNEANEFVENALKTKTLMIDAARRGSLSPQLSTRDLLGELRGKDRSPVRSFLPNAAVKKWSAHDGEINCIQISRDGSTIATGGNDKRVILYDAYSCSPRTSLAGSLQAVMSVSFNLTGEMILGTSNDNSAKIWNVSTGRLRHTLTGHIGKVYSAKFTDSNKVVSGSHDRTIKIWDLGKGFCMRTIFTLSSCNDLSVLDGDGTVIVSGHLDNNVRLWDSRTGNQIREITGIHHGQVTAVDVSPDGTYIMTTSRDNTIKLMDVRMYDVVAVFNHDRFRVGMNWSKSCFSPDTMYIASGSADGALYFWQLNPLKMGSGISNTNGTPEIIMKDQHRGSICGAVWGPMGGSTVYSADKDRGIVMWGST
ncbi:WD40-repeat-containing domain protein [Cladochytrium replicatum]|nr:WD40-repeat-containing domain protein [Cladochytrium replicatum]